MIISNSLELHTPQFRVLSDHQCQELYKAAISCLEQVGIQMHNAAARNLMVAHGARVKGNTVHLPANLVKQSIHAAPHEFLICGRDEKHDMQIALDRVHFGPGPSCTYFIDPTTNERRKAQRGDAGMVARVCDALPNIDYIMGLSLFDDVPPALSPVYEFAEEIANTTKPIVAWANTPETFMDIYKLAVAVAGSKIALQEKPLFAYFTTYESPLKLADGPLANMILAAKHKIPVICLGGADGRSGITLHRRLSADSFPGQRPGSVDGGSNSGSRRPHGHWRLTLHDGFAYSPPGLRLPRSQPAFGSRGRPGALPRPAVYGNGRCI